MEWFLILFMYIYGKEKGIRLTIRIMATSEYFVFIIYTNNKRILFINEENAIVTFIRSMKNWIVNVTAINRSL